MTLLEIHSPHGTAWELLVVVLVIIVAPVLVERVRIPGMIGLLVGGCIIGPQVLGVVSDTTGILKALGDLGILYLMFLAGLELDLGVFARHRNKAIVFSALTFCLPTLFGTIGGLAVGYSLAGSILLGSLFASYTLIVYPIVRNMGLASNPAIAATVGATVLTDTVALVLLAFIAGSASGDAGGIELLAQVGLGLAVVVGWSFGVLPRVAGWFFSGIGQPRTLRYVFALAALLSAGVIAEVVGIEGIVGAFFAGLGLNRLVPNEGEFMERIEFFGSALLIPAFLVSIGTIIDPRVLVDPGTLGLAAIFIVICVGGKLLAATLCIPLLGFTRDEAGVVFGLSVPQAAATLAATFVGLRVGLFTTSTVNAIMIVIVVSLIAASMSVTVFGRRMPKPAVDQSRLGRSIVAHCTSADSTRAVLSAAATIATADAGLVRPTYIVAAGAAPPDDALREDVDAEITRLALDADLAVRHDRSVTDGLLHDVRSHDASLLLVPATSQSWLPTLFGASEHALIAQSPVPVALVRAGTARPTRAMLALAPTQARRPTSAALLAAAIAVHYRTMTDQLVVVTTEPLADDLADVLGKHIDLTMQNPQQWLEANGDDHDVVIVPGGRNGAMTTARITRQAALTGSTVIAVADRASVTTNVMAAERLGVVTSRPALRTR